MQAGVTNLQKAGYDSANIFDKAVMPPSSVTHQVGTCRPDFMLPEVRLAVLLPGNLVASSGFSRAQDLLSPWDWCCERQYFLLPTSVKSGCGCFGALTVLIFDVPLIVPTITSFCMASVWGIPIS